MSSASFIESRALGFHGVRRATFSLCTSQSLRFDVAQVVQVCGLGLPSRPLSLPLGFVVDFPSFPVARG